MKKEKTKNTYIFTVKVWLHPGGTANWHFLTVPKRESSEIKNVFREFTRGWGSLPVLVTIKKTSWNTSIFLDRKSGTYLLPLKKEIRRIEDLQIEDTVTVTIKILP